MEQDSASQRFKHIYEFARLAIERSSAVATASFFYKITIFFKQTRISTKNQKQNSKMAFVKSSNGDHGADLALIIMPFDLLHQLCLSALSKQYGEWVGCDQNADTGFPQTCSFFLLQGNNDHDM